MFSLVLTMRVFLSRSDCSPLGLLLSLDWAGSRPDGVIWSMQTKAVIWIELTSPWEKNLTKKYFETMDKYNKLAIDLREGKQHGVKWTVAPLCIEVGARGAINEQP